MSKKIENPYPKDVFLWDNNEKLDFNRGRFNQHCFEVWENAVEETAKNIFDDIEEIKCIEKICCNEQEGGRKAHCIFAEDYLKLREKYLGEKK